MSGRVGPDYPRAKAPAGMGRRYVREKDVEHACDQRYLAAGCVVIRFSQSRATKQTPGIPDRKVYHPPSRTTWWHEVKKPGGIQSADQARFQVDAEACGEMYVLGGVEAAEAQLIKVGLAKIVPGVGFTFTPGGWRP